MNEENIVFNSEDVENNKVTFGVAGPFAKA